MAHFAQLNDSNVVINVIVVADSDAPNEAAGIAFCKNLQGADTNWVQTSYNTYAGKHYTFISDGIREYDGGAGLRKNYAGVGMLYDSVRDAFYAPQPFASWTLDTNRCIWEAPIANPGGREGDGKIYSWDEDNTQWVEIT